MKIIHLWLCLACVNTQIFCACIYRDVRVKTRITETMTELLPPADNALPIVLDISWIYQLLWIVHFRRALLLITVVTYPIASFYTTS